MRATSDRPAEQEQISVQGIFSTAIQYWSPAAARMDSLACSLWSPQHTRRRVALMSSVPHPAARMEPTGAQSGTHHPRRSFFTISTGRFVPSLLASERQCRCLNLLLTSVNVSRLHIGRAPTPGLASASTAWRVCPRTPRAVHHQCFPCATVGPGKIKDVWERSQVESNLVALRRPIGPVNGPLPPSTRLLRRDRGSLQPRCC